MEPSYSSNNNGNQNHVLDEDAFWEVAFMERSEPGAMRHHDVGSSNDNDNDDDNDDVTAKRPHTYIIPNSNCVVLHLQPLPSLDGIWTPLGADAWYVCENLCMLDASYDDFVSFFHGRHGWIPVSQMTRRRNKLTLVLLFALSVMYACCGIGMVPLS